MKCCRCIKQQKLVSRLRMGAFLLILMLMVLAAESPAAAAQLTIPDLKAKPGKDVGVPLIVDEVQRLAGVKLILSYNKDLLVYKGAARTKNTDSMMHVVNDKTPGKLIVVMAGAVGITGKNINLLTLFFGVRGANGAVAVIKADDVQLMGDDLKDIPCKAKAGKVTVVQ